MTAALPTIVAAVLGAASAACLLGLPSPGALRLSGLRGPRSPPRPHLQVWYVAAPAAVAVLVLAGVLVTLLGVLAVLALQRAGESRRRAALRRDERRRAVEACAALAAELRAGRSAAAALAVAADLASGPARDALQNAACAARLGHDVAGALLHSAGGPGTASTTAQSAVPEVLRALAACWSVCSASGSGLAGAVDRLEEGLRADQERRRVVAAELAGPRATAGLLAVLPAAGFLLATGLGADPVGVLFGTPLGLVCLSAGLLLDGLGLLWTSRLVARAGGRS